jgi:hypothetical protein
VPENGDNSNLAQSGAAADQGFSEQPASQTAVDCKDKTWVAIELLDPDGKPVPKEEYRLQLPDGSIQEGTLDENGAASISGIDPGTCKVCFPRIDGRVWRPL